MKNVLENVYSVVGKRGADHFWDRSSKIMTMARETMNTGGSSKGRL